MTLANISRFFPRLEPAETDDEGISIEQVREAAAAIELPMVVVAHALPAATLSRSTIQLIEETNKYMVRQRMMEEERVLNHHRRTEEQRKRLKMANAPKPVEMRVTSNSLGERRSSRKTMVPVNYAKNVSDVAVRMSYDD
jgi:hypothetical protein